MKTNVLFLTMLLIVSLCCIAGCGNEDESEGDKKDTSEKDTEKDGGDDTEVEDEIQADLSGCDLSKTCLYLDNPKECIANFELGTTQAGFDSYDNIGFYGYNDKTPGATMIPAPNNYDSEPAVKVKSCDESNKWVLRMSGKGFTDWGAGIGMDWGGPANPDCETEEALECLEIGYADPNFLIADAEKDPRCQDKDGKPDVVKMRCLIHGKNYKETRDLSDYKGIGFWVLRVDPDSAPAMQVNFGIPETTRFLADPHLAEEYRRDDVTYENGCSDDIGIENQKCYNDFAATFRVLNTELNKWVYREILFEDLKYNSGWGLQPKQYTSFPAGKSVGMKFQTPGASENFDFYFDDIHLIK